MPINQKLVQVKEHGDKAFWALVKDSESVLYQIPEDALLDWDTLETSDLRPVTPSQNMQHLSPVPAYPPNIFGIGLNYRAHAEETGAAIPTEPFVFQKVTTSILAPGQPIRLPEQAPFEVDYEAELAVIIRKPASCILQEQAEEYILGYTCVNDVSARDCQFKRDSQWTRAKGFDTFCPIGPAIVSPQEFNAVNADIFLEVNGQTMQSGNTSDMVFSPAELVSYLSHQFTLMPWTVICTGTPPGVGIGRNPAVYLRNGDTVSITIPGIGSLENPVIGPAQLPS